MSMSSGKMRSNCIVALRCSSVDERQSNEASGVKTTSNLAFTNRAASFPLLFFGVLRHASILRGKENEMYCVSKCAGSMEAIQEYLENWR
jgi:hypothetical protein